jgi:hypothetical protein
MNVGIDAAEWRRRFRGGRARRRERQPSASGHHVRPFYRRRRQVSREAMLIMSIDFVLTSITCEFSGGPQAVILAKTAEALAALD